MEKTNEFIRKEFKLSTKTIDKIEKLKYAKEQQNPGIKIYEKDIIVDAIDYAFSAKFGKDVFDQTMSKLELVLGNMMKGVLNEYMVRFAQALENLDFNDSQLKEMMMIIIKANDILPKEMNKITSLLMMNQELDENIKNAVLLKQEIEKQSDNM